MSAIFASHKHTQGSQGSPWRERIHQFIVLMLMLVLAALALTWLWSSIGRNGLDVMKPFFGVAFAFYASVAGVFLVGGAAVRLGSDLMIVRDISRPKDSAS